MLQLNPNPNPNQMDYWILSVYQILSVRLNYEGNLQNLQIIKTTNTMNDECEMIATFFGILLGTLVTISGCALLALEIIQLVIAAVFLFPKIKLIVVSFLNRITFVRSIRTWFRKRAKQPGKSKGRIITFKHGARGFIKVSACSGGWVIKHTEAIK